MTALPAAERHKAMLEAAVALARIGFAAIGWASVSDGKAPTRRWKADATDDPALVAKLLHGARNSLVIPKDRAIIIDIDRAEAWAALAAAGLPPTFTIDTPTPDHGHVYGLVPPDIDVAMVPGTFEHGEIRRFNPTTGTASMVLGPWSLRSDGIYTPRGNVRTIAWLPESIIEYLIGSAGHQNAERSAARGPADAGWKIANGRHDYLVGRARWLRGNGLSGGRLVDELLRLDRDRCDPPLVNVPGRGEAEVRLIADWTDGEIGDDPPPITITGTAPEPEPEADTWAETWPAPPADAAYHGVLGDVALAVAPITEADPIGILGTMVSLFGSACGGGRSIFQGSTQRTNTSILLVGATAFQGRKGTATGVALDVLRLAYPEIMGLQLPGVASGEGITGHFDRAADAAKKSGATPEARVLIIEPEFGRLLTVLNREGSTLSPILRNAWDGTPLGFSRARTESIVTDHHVTLLGHITPVELRLKLTDTDAANGFANRILFLAVQRQRLLPFTDPVDAVAQPFIKPLHLAIVEAQPTGKLVFDPAARDRWAAFYIELAQTPRFGLAGAVTGRHETQVARLALVYALADRSPAVGEAHLDAAIALAEYAWRSVIWALGDSTGNRHADVLRGMLADGEVTYDEAQRATGLRTGADLDEAVNVLVDAGLARVVKTPRPGGGRPRRVIRANTANTANTARGEEMKGTKYST